MYWLQFISQASRIWTGVTPCSHDSGEDHKQCETLATKITGPNYVIKAMLPRWNIFTRCDVGLQMSCHCCYCYHSTWRKSPNPFTFSVIAGITYSVLISPELCELSSSGIWTNSSTHLIFVCAFILLEIGKYLALVKMGKRVLVQSSITWGKECGDSGLYNILQATISALESYPGANHFSFTSIHPLHLCGLLPTLESFLNRSVSLPAHFWLQLQN